MIFRLRLNTLSTCGVSQQHVCAAVPSARDGAAGAFLTLLGMTKAELRSAEAGVPAGLKAQRSVLQFKDVPEKPPVQAEAAHINIPGSARRRREIPAKSLVHRRLWNISRESRVLSVGVSAPLPHRV